MASFHKIASIFVLLVLASGIDGNSQVQIKPAYIKPKEAIIPGNVLSRVDSLVEIFRHSNYALHRKTEELLIDQQKAAIPALIEMLWDTSYQKLTNTLDLIYPGATRFYGHGHIVPYELDWVAVRAGRLIEEITFENFGYNGSPISDEHFMRLHINDHAAYLQTGAHHAQFSSRPDAAEFRLQILDRAKIVLAWWHANMNDWTRMDALRNALNSQDEVRQERALTYLAFATTKCDGLCPESFKAALLPAVQQLASSTIEKVAEQARVVADEGFTWRRKDLGKNQKQ